MYLALSCALGVALLVCLFSCSHAAAPPAATTTIAAPATTVPVTSTTTTTTLPHIGPVQAGEKPELLRFTLRPVANETFVLPEDFAYGPVLNLSAVDSAKVRPALDTIQDWINALKDGKSLEPTSTKDAARLGELNFGPQRKQLSTLSAVRFLAQYRIGDSFADFDVLIATQTGRARLSFYLIPDKIPGKWLISDVQGDLATLSQSVDSEYTDYAPKDAERQLIREGHQIQWQ